MEIMQLLLHLIHQVGAEMLGLLVVLTARETLAEVLVAVAVALAWTSEVARRTADLVRGSSSGS
jgi:hypothetical protein